MRGGGSFREALARAGEAATGKAAAVAGRAAGPVGARSGARGARQDGAPRRPGERAKGAGRADPVERLLARLVAPPSADGPGAGRGDRGDGGPQAGGGKGAGQGGGEGQGGGDRPERGDERSRGDGTGPAAGGTPLLASAVARIALLVNSGAAPAVSVQLGRSVEVRVAQAESGVEVMLCPARGLSPMAEAELPLLVAALRARGVRVARAGVRAGARTAAGPVADDGAAGPSLTPPRASATRAGDDGSVAKW